jgi:hypothetical protein
MMRRLGSVTAALFLALSVSLGVSPSPAAAKPIPCGTVKTFYALAYYACITSNTTTFQATLHAYRTSSTYSFNGVKLAIRITSNGNRVTGTICDSSDITHAINTGQEATCDVQAGRSHSGATVRGEGWVAFNNQCVSDSCIGYRSAYPDLAKSPGLIS